MKKYIINYEDGAKRNDLNIIDNSARDIDSLMK